MQKENETVRIVLQLGYITKKNYGAIIRNYIRNWKGSRPSNVEKLAGAGSNREYYRLFDEDGNTVIGVIGTSRDENHAFI